MGLALFWSKEAPAQDTLALSTVVIGGSGLLPVEINLEDVLAPQQSQGRDRPIGNTKSGWAPGERPAVADISSLDPSLLAPPKRRITRSALSPTRSRKLDAAASRTVAVALVPRAGTRIPATSLAAETGPADTAARSAPQSIRVAVLPKLVPARKLPAAKPSKTATARKENQGPKKRLAVVPPSPTRTSKESAKLQPPPAPKPAPQAPSAKAERPIIPLAVSTTPKPPTPKPASVPTVNAPTTKPTVASVPPSSAPTPSGVITRLIFPTGNADVSGPLAQQLDTVTTTMLARDERLLLQAYAAAGQAGASGSRRLSLARALEVRSYLIRKGLKSTRIDVRALGTSAASGPADRVDIILLTR